jgi:hypothetical protein
MMYRSFGLRIHSVFFLSYNRRFDVMWLPWKPNAKLCISYLCYDQKTAVTNGGVSVGITVSTFAGKLYLLDYYYYAYYIFLLLFLRLFLLLPLGAYT